jgi:hypothetical protein
MTTTQLPDYAGLYQYRTARSTGLKVGLYDGEAAGMDIDGGRWQTVCEPHGFICSHLTLAEAREHSVVPEEWCEACSAILHGCPCDGPAHESSCGLYDQEVTEFPPTSRLGRAAQ